MITLHHTPAIPHYWVAIRDDGDKRLIPAVECNGHPMYDWDSYPHYRGNYTLERAPAYVERFCRLCDR